MRQLCRTLLPCNEGALPRGRLLNCKCLQHKVTCLANQLIRLPPRLQDCDTFRGWWNFYASGQKPISVVKHKRSRAAKRGFTDYLRSEKASKFLQIFTAIGPPKAISSYDQMYDDFMDCFYGPVEAAAKKKKIPRRRSAKPVTASGNETRTNKSLSLPNIRNRLNKTQVVSAIQPTAAKRFKSADDQITDDLADFSDQQSGGKRQLANMQKAKSSPDKLESSEQQIGEKRDSIAHSATPEEQTDEMSENSSDSSNRWILMEEHPLVRMRESVNLNEEFPIKSILMNDIPKGRTSSSTTPYDSVQQIYNKWLITYQGTKKKRSRNAYRRRKARASSTTNMPKFKQKKLKVYKNVPENKKQLSDSIHHYKYIFGIDRNAEGLPTKQLSSDKKRKKTPNRKEPIKNDNENVISEQQTHEDLVAPTKHKAQAVAKAKIEAELIAHGEHGKYIEKPKKSAKQKALSVVKSKSNKSRTKFVDRSISKMRTEMNIISGQQGHKYLMPLMAEFETELNAEKTPDEQEKYINKPTKSTKSTANKTRTLSVDRSRSTGKKRLLSEFDSFESIAIKYLEYLKSVRNMANPLEGKRKIKLGYKRNTASNRSTKFLKENVIELELSEESVSPVPSALSIKSVSTVGITTTSASVAPEHLPSTPSDIELIEPTRRSTRKSTTSLSSKSYSSVMFSQLTPLRSIDSSRRNSDTNKFIPIDIESHIKNFMSANDVTWDMFKSLPRNWPCPYESSVVQRMRRESNMRDKQKPKRKLKKGTLRRQNANLPKLIKAASCNLCRYLRQVEPDPPYMNEMRKRQVRNDLKQFYKCRLMADCPQANQCIRTQQISQSKRIVNLMLLRKLVESYELLGECRDRLSKLKQLSCAA